MAIEIDADGGSYTISGSSADIVRQFVVLGGSYTISGTSATFYTARRVSAGGGSYLLSGSNATFIVAGGVFMLPGSYTISGTDASLLFSDPGTVVFTTGQSMTVTDGSVLATESRAVTPVFGGIVG